MTKNIPSIITTLSESIRDAGGRALLVGGCVRDMLLDATPKDFDIEVYGLEPAKLQSIASEFGEVIEVGRAFGILKLRAEISPSLPRRSTSLEPGEESEGSGGGEYDSLDGVRTKRRYSRHHRRASLEDVRFAILAMSL